jgi:hypothetical protein
MGNGKWAGKNKNRETGNGKRETERTGPRPALRPSGGPSRFRPISHFPFPVSRFSSVHTPFTSATSFVIEAFASPNSIDVLGL